MSNENNFYKIQLDFSGRLYDPQVLSSVVETINHEVKDIENPALVILLEEETLTIKPNPNNDHANSELIYNELTTILSVLIKYLKNEAKLEVQSGNQCEKNRSMRAILARIIAQLQNKIDNIELLSKNYEKVYTKLSLYRRY